MSVELGTEDVIRLRYVEREITVGHPERGARGLISRGNAGAKAGYLVRGQSPLPHSILE